MDSYVGLLSVARADPILEDIGGILRYIGQWGIKVFGKYVQEVLVPLEDPACTRFSIENIQLWIHRQEFMAHIPKYIQKYIDDLNDKKVSTFVTASWKLLGKIDRPYKGRYFCHHGIAYGPGSGPGKSLNYLKVYFPDGRFIRFDLILGQGKSTIPGPIGFDVNALTFEYFQGGINKCWGYFGGDDFPRCHRCTNPVLDSTSDEYVHQKLQEQVRIIKARIIAREARPMASFAAECQRKCDTLDECGRFRIMIRSLMDSVASRCRRQKLRYFVDSSRKWKMQ